MKKVNDFLSNKPLSEKIKKAICSFPPFEKLSDEIIASGAVSLCSYNSGDIVYDENNFEKALGIIVSGSVSVTKSKNDGRVDMKIISSNGIFGAAALFGDHEKYSSVIKSKGKTTYILFIPEAFIRDLFLKHPEASLEYIRFLSEKIRYLNERIGLFTGEDSYSRLCDYLIKNGSASISASSLARSLDISRSAFYRSLSKLEDKGIISKNDKMINVEDIEKLKKERNIK